METNVIVEKNYSRPSVLRFTQQPLSSAVCECQCKSICEIVPYFLVLSLQGEGDITTLGFAYVISPIAKVP